MSVIVAGAGPTGLLLAGDLAAAGVPVTVLEKRAEGVSNLSRAFGVHARTLELLDARGLADELVPTGQVISELRLFGSLPFDIGRLPSRFPFLLVTPQYEVEKLLLKRAHDVGVVFRHGTEVTGLRQDDNGVTVTTSAGEFGASYLVGADGVRSAVRAAAGLPFPGRVLIRSVVLADVKLVDEPDITVRVHGDRDAFGFIAPFGDGYWRIGGWDRRHRDLPDDTPVEFEELRSITERAFGTDYGMHSPRWLGRFHSDERQVPGYRAGRVLLAGDAAHQHSPAGGQGMNTGLQDAANLSWKLAAAVGGWGPAALLDSYHDERHPVGKAVLRSSGLNLRLAMARNPAEVALRFVRTQVVKHVPAVSRAAIGEITGIGYGYPAPRGAHRLTGKRVPDHQLASGRLYEALRAGKFVLVLPSGTEADIAPGRVITAHWPDDRSDALLVRPDGYTAWAADSPEVSEIESAALWWTGSRD
ncbi:MULTISPECIES: FAD-dependent oxidoreductase [unclassified Amycolatopsis]|uniref:FAD-dependent oxidoreductase n=1 Tax=unclassified Amycolatopsis TaxID=2618356 RepID=UPI0028745EAC|nr:MULTISPECIES: FAD-dependent oxidoreductase [unclassified Amycolatopsis]MDS0135826.1 FAD-dependent oxidoreductase [Amycolatopsis sp. 505]MDS0145573.1 FAD-dependent oxidoreductase [Amycolatopsis sp. CM201R]